MMGDGPHSFWLVWFSCISHLVAVPAGKQSLQAAGASYPHTLTVFLLIVAFKSAGSRLTREAAVMSKVGAGDSFAACLCKIETRVSPAGNVDRSEV